MLYKFSENVYYTKHRYTYLEPAIGYIKGSNFSVMVDAGNSKEQIETFLKELEEENLPKPSYIILTHYHWDHSFGAYYTDIPIISSFKTKQYLEELDSWSWDDNSIDERVEKNIETEYSVNIFKKIYADKDVKIKIPNIIKQGDFILNLGNIKVNVFYNDNSHSDDALLIYLKDEKVIFIGDSHSKSYLTKPMSFDKVKLGKYIETISEIDFEYAIPGHGNIIKKEDLLASLSSEYTKL